jgi:hypothetical protein
VIPSSIAGVVVAASAVNRLLSADGDTATWAGLDDRLTGAAWLHTRSKGAWTSECGRGSTPNGTKKRVGPTMG